MTTLPHQAAEAAGLEQHRDSGWYFVPPKGSLPSDHPAFLPLIASRLRATTRDCSFDNYARYIAALMYLVDGKPAEAVMRAAEDRHITGAAMVMLCKWELPTAAQFVREVG